MAASAKRIGVGTLFLALLVAAGCGSPSGGGTAGQEAIPRTAWDGHPDLTGVWEGTALSEQAYALSELEGLYQPAVKETMKALTAKDDPANACIPYGSPRHQAMGFPVQIVESPGGVAILSDRPHMFRYIPTDGRPHLQDVFPTNLGNPVARWDVDTLVVDITSFNGRIWLAGGPQHSPAGGAGGWPTSEALHVVERWRLIDANTLEYQATVEDSNVLTQPWTTPKMTYKRSDAGQIGEGICIPEGFDFETPTLAKRE